MWCDAPKTQNAQAEMHNTHLVHACTATKCTSTGHRQPVTTSACVGKSASNIKSIALFSAYAIKCLASIQLCIPSCWASECVYDDSSIVRCSIQNGISSASHTTAFSFPSAIHTCTLHTRKKYIRSSEMPVYTALDGNFLSSRFDGTHVCVCVCAAHKTCTILLYCFWGETFRFDWISHRVASDGAPKRVWRAKQMQPNETKALTYAGQTYVRWRSRWSVCAPAMAHGWGEGEGIQ